MIKCIIIDDEQDGRDVLQLLITDFCPGVSIAEMCSNGKDGVKAIQKHHPDLVFLDIDMPDMSGFEVLDCVKNQKMKVVFVTAHNQYAIRAFRYSAIDYILKPASPQAILEAVEKAEQVEFRNNANQYELLSATLKNENQLPEVIALPLADGLQVARITEIMYCKADKNYTHVHFTNGKKLLVSKQLKEFETILAPHGFFRVHNSFLVNIAQVSKYIRGEGGYLLMNDNASIEVSRQKKDELLRLLNRV